jgi:hypothetical protein
MSKVLTALMRETIERELPELRALSEAAALVRPNGEGSWSPKEELGHLIDSAANNHVRFVNAALGPEYRGPGYAQNDWVSIHDYQGMPWEAIVSFWYEYNRLLARAVERIPAQQLSIPCFIGSAAGPVTLGFAIEDYVLHMRRHIDHLLQRSAITQYPSALPSP